MKTNPPSTAELVSAVADAARSAIQKLFREHQGERFYYLALITTGEILPPCLTAWSFEALDAAVEHAGDEPGTRGELKWSTADSPYYCFEPECFEGVRQLFQLSESACGGDDVEKEIARGARMEAMVRAMKQLDEEGLFGTGLERDQLFVNVEWMPPDYTNTDRARRLNTPQAMAVWLAEAAED